MRERYRESLTGREPASRYKESLTGHEWARLTAVHDTLAACHPKLGRGQVWCKTCGSTQRVDSGAALQFGWPKCCGYTMTIDAPNER